MIDFGNSFSMGEAPEVKTKEKFPPTDEQQQIIDAVAENKEKKLDRIVKINALAGSGKTSVLEMLADNNPETSLYLAFNKSMAEEAKGRFPSHVDCMTTHSLAYRTVGVKYTHKLSRPRGKYVNVAATGPEIARFFKIPDYEVSHGVHMRSFWIGQIIRETVIRYSQSADDVISQKHIPYHQLKSIKGRYPKADLEKLKKFFVRYANKLWDEKIDELSEVLMTHDDYLKLYQLSKPVLDKYTNFYLDEAQDTAECVMDIFLNQKNVKDSTLVLVGDQFQSIYQWRGSINLFERIKEGITFHLSKSFRFGQTVADIGQAVIKDDLPEGICMKGFEKIESVAGDNVVDTSKPYTILFRTNMELLFAGIDLITKGKSVNVNFDTKDFINIVKSAKALRCGDMRNVKHENIIPFNDWKELEQETESDPELKRVFKIIESGDDLRILNILYNYKSTGREDITLLTCHKAKGLEADQVILTDGFPSIYDKKTGKYVGLEEGERNLLYVAATRAKKKLNINRTIKEILESQECSNEGGMEIGSISITQVDGEMLQEIEYQGLVEPKGEMALEAYERGLNEVFDGESELDGEVPDELCMMPMDLPSIRKEINSLIKDI